ncbi:hypothetical protein [Portibacter marinus]|uniref:hypothetical protein n=1 Tax=Portibacter marinus TaxID=2898660 RepID=UPI001F343280|nr:hypothetical protein [Portibacter marinus]
MNQEFDLNELLQKGKITSELELQRATMAQRKLRLYSNEIENSESKRQRLVDMIEQYESKYWSDHNKVTDQQVIESDEAEESVLKEINFIDSRKKLIRSRLKKLGINQQEFGIILGHTSKSYMSELMNGVVPFTLKDLIVISKLLKIKLDKLIPIEINTYEKIKIEKSIEKLNHPQLKFDREKFSISV